MISVYPPFLVSLENLLQFCFDFMLCPFTVRQDSSKINGFPDALWDMFLLNGVMFFVTCFFITQERGRKVKTLGFYISHLSPCFSF